MSARKLRPQQQCSSSVEAVSLARRDNGGTHVASSTFSPDGKSIATSKGREGGNIDAYVVRLGGTQTRA